MDIVSRLEYFLKKSGLSNSAFADACDIPRPTLTQLLKRRNKKVSDEIIAKIHSTYPNLSVMWLLFGDEPMFVGQNSGAQKVVKDTPDTPQNLFSQQPYESPKRETEINFLGETDAPQTPQNSDKNVADLAGDFLSAIKNSASQATMTGANLPANARKVVSIYVFYSDKSFDVFTPSR